MAAVAIISGAAQAPTDGARLDSLVDRFIKMRRDSSQGIVASAARRATTFRALRDELEAIPPARLNPEQQVDWMAIKGQIAGTLHDLETLRAWEKNAEAFVQFGSVSNALAQEGLPTARADRVIEALAAATAALAEAKTALKTPVRRFTEGAIYQAREWLTFVKSDVASFAAGAGEARPRLESANAAAISALDSFIAYLEKDVLPRSTTSFDIGKAEYARILKEHWFMDAGPDEILARGQRAFAETEKLAQQVAERIKPGAPGSRCMKS